MDARGRVAEMEVIAVVTRADGTVEDLGRIAHYNRSRFRRLLAKLRREQTRR